MHCNKYYIFYSDIYIALFGVTGAFLCVYGDLWHTAVHVMTMHHYNSIKAICVRGQTLHTAAVTRVAT